MAEAELPPAPVAACAGTERALEEAAASGSLSLAGRRLRVFPGGAAQRWDLSDTTQADLSRNRFAEVPVAACQLVALEGLSLYHNCLRSIPPAIANLQALTYLNLSRNQLSSLPACLCRLPLRVLIASNNKLVVLPDDIGALRALRQLDVSCNELQALPRGVAFLAALRDLNLRRNRLAILPEELSELPLVRLDFSCNHVSRIPASYRHLRHLQTILLDNNPLQSPPAQVCLRGKFHIFKYLNIEACGKAGLDPSIRPNGLPDEFYPARPHGGLDSGFNSVDSGSKRWSGNELVEEFSELSFRVAELTRDPRLPRTCGTALDTDLEQIDFIDSSVNGEEDEEAKPEEKLKVEPSPAPSTLPRPAPPREDPPGEERRRPETLQLWQERERQQQALETRNSFRRMPRTSSGLAPGSSLAESGWQKPRTQGPEQPPSPPQAPRLQEPPPSTSPVSRDPGPAPAPRPSSFLFRSSSRSTVRPSLAAAAPPDPTPDLDEKELMAQLRQAIESRVRVTLGEDLGAALANGAVLCQLANQLRPRSVPLIHVPSPAVPKLNAVKSRKNVESFLEACRRMGVPEAALPPAPAGLHPPDPEDPPPPAAPPPLAPFALFYMCSMALLYLAYQRLCPF
ncbi:leucine-rich repeat and calponin-like proteiny domain-containing protein 4 isoform B [Alligator mississippiensis]|uniref:Leucine-rich repeat and calponin-like proteiny domain-containing protein 4 isoform B n=1 Tax=Alligator mississippiensis TaxID=8496 RepID=A0A151M8M8_ALLMI|nr:leucine-rich repeat and calponin-like proteiny domain-containing protein 4 isoform B [Alligator mississippiensis]